MRQQIEADKKGRLPFSELNVDTYEDEVSKITYDRTYRCADEKIQALAGVPSNQVTIPMSNWQEEAPDGATIIRQNVRQVLRHEENRRRSTAVWGMSRLQNIATVLAHLFALASCVLVFIWINEEAMGGGGLSWEEGQAPKVFNWHPVMMILSLAFMTIAALAFRVRSRGVNRKGIKIIHGMQWTLAMCCGTIGLFAAFKSQNDAKSGFLSHFYSFHSWVGLSVMALFLCQFSVAFASFGLQIRCIGVIQRPRVLSFHRFVGNFIYMMTTSTVLLGITEKLGFMGCSYNSLSSDTIPFQGLLEIPRVCRIGNVLGMVVFCMAFLTAYALFNFPEYQDRTSDIRPTKPKRNTNYIAPVRYSVIPEGNVPRPLLSRPTNGDKFVPSFR
mmetsp:Transcript_2961/g.3481  ORF Transcript_2961/g.3481 Transcript_2961/m.3481 type:complete len:386 (-) Transcript_2961:632-1789(-)